MRFPTAHAQVTMLRGKRKHLCDMSLEIDWLLQLDTQTEPAAEAGAQGKGQVLQGSMQVSQ